MRNISSVLYGVKKCECEVNRLLQNFVSIGYKELVSVRMVNLFVFRTDRELDWYTKHQQRTIKSSPFVRS